MTKTNKLIKQKVKEFEKYIDWKLECEDIPNFFKRDIVENAKEIFQEVAAAAVKEAREDLEIEHQKELVRVHKEGREEALEEVKELVVTLSCCDAIDECAADKVLYDLLRKLNS